MAPDKISNFVGGMGALLGFGALSKITNGEEPVDWKWIVGIAGAIIGCLLVIVGFLISAGLNNNQATLLKIENRQSMVIQNQAELKTQMVLAVGTMEKELGVIKQRVDDHIDQTRGLWYKRDKNGN